MPPRKLTGSAGLIGLAGEVPAEDVKGAGGDGWWTTVDGCGNDDDGGGS